MSQLVRPAPEWEVETWLNSREPLSLASLKGKVVLAGAFQMLCPGCVSQMIPQLIQVHRLFPSTDLVVVGLHTVFEHHAAMGPQALAAFLHEYRVPFPVAIDRASGTGDPLPRTMRRYGMRGTPTLLLIDRQGNLRGEFFGHVSDLQLGAEVASLIGERAGFKQTVEGHAGSGCTDAACAAG